MNTATINIAALPAFKAFVAKKNAKAIKLGCPEINVTISEPYTKIEVTDAGDFEHTMVDISVDESTIKIGGYSVLGRIDDVDGSVIVSGYTDMSKYRNVSMTRCDHCNTARSRKHLVLLGDENNNELVVGSTCLQDFTGHMSALSYLSYYSWAMNLKEFCDSEFGKSIRSTPVYDINYVLSVGAKMVRHTGYYVSKAKAEETGRDSTREMVMTYVFSPEVRKDNPVLDVDVAYAKEALEWYASTNHEDTDFHYNVKTLLEKEYISSRYFGFILAILPMYEMTKERVARVPSKHIGAVGQKKVRMNVVLKNAINLGQFTYGAPVTMLYILKAGDDMVVYKTGSVDFKEGVEYTIEATIKDHTDYKGNAQTVITRGKIIAEKEIE